MIPPADIFSAVTLTECRGAVLLITTTQNQPITFKYMSGPLKDSQFELHSLSKVSNVFVFLRRCIQI